jgi:hypothetical protein
LLRSVREHDCDHIIRGLADKWSAHPELSFSVFGRECFGDTASLVAVLRSSQSGGIQWRFNFFEIAVGLDLSGADAEALSFGAR